MPPVVSIIGRSKSGKTTLVEGLIRELKSRGYRVATIKHTPYGMSFDEPDKDSWRHLEAGCEATAIGSQAQMVLVKPVAQAPTLDELVYLLGDAYDIILTEGFKQDRAPKIEVHRKGVGPPLVGIKKLIAIATDEPLETKTRQFPLQDIAAIADLLEKGFIQPRRERLSLYINNNKAPVSLRTFPKKIITNVLLAMVSTLKGVGEVSSLEIFLKKGPKQD